MGGGHEASECNRRMVRCTDIKKKGRKNTITRKRTSKYIWGNESVFFWIARMVFFPCGNKDRFYLVKIRGAKKKHGVGRSWTDLNAVGCCWTHLDAVGRC